MQRPLRDSGDRSGLTTGFNKGWADASRMAGADRKTKPVKGMTNNRPKRGPEWASGLKQLYDSVVDEPLPDAFKDLLSRLDDAKK